MWQIKQIHDRDYAINAEHDVEKSRFCIYVISLEELSLWIYKQNDNEVICRTKELNKLIEIDADDVIPEILELFNASNADVEWGVEKDDTSITLNLNSMSSGYKFVFCTTLQKSDDKTYSEVFTLPLLVILKNFQSLTDQLCKLLRNKDEEIMEYKLNGATVTRKNVETTTFDEMVLNEIFTQHLPSSISKTSKELLDSSVISYLNQVQPFGRQKLKERQCVVEPPKTLVDSLEVPSLAKPTAELKKKPEEKKTEPLKKAPQKTKQIFKTKPVKKLKNL